MYSGRFFFCHKRPLFVIDKKKWLCLSSKKWNNIYWLNSSVLLYFVCNISFSISSFNIFRLSRLYVCPNLGICTWCFHLEHYSSCDSVSTCSHTEHKRLSCAWWCSILYLIEKDYFTGDTVLLFLMYDIQHHCMHNSIYIFNDVSCTQTLMKLRAVSCVCVFLHQSLCNSILHVLCLVLMWCCAFLKWYFQVKYSQDCVCFWMNLVFNCNFPYYFYPTMDLWFYTFVIFYCLKVQNVFSSGRRCCVSCCWWNFCCARFRFFLFTFTIRSFGCSKCSKLYFFTLFFSGGRGFSRFSM